MHFALITGAAKRIGANIALHLAKKKWNIILHYFKSEADAKSLKQKIIANGVECILIKADLRKELTFSKNLPKISLLINNAAEFKNDNIFSLSYNCIKTHMNVNLVSPAMLASEMANQYDNEEFEGNIINILDYSIYKHPKNFLSYSLSKNALANLTKTLASQLAPDIRVNAIALGQTLKNKSQSTINYKAARDNTPLKNQASIKEICYSIDFILKIKSMTGQIINLDSGMSISDQKYQ